MRHKTVKAFKRLKKFDTKWFRIRVFSAPLVHVHKTTGNIYFKYWESNVEVLDQAPVPLVRLLHEGHQHVFVILFWRTFIEQFLNLDSILWISPEAVWGAKNDTIYHFTTLPHEGWIWRICKTVWQPVPQCSVLFCLSIWCTLY